MNIAYGVRYQTDIASMYAGPYLGHFARQIQNIIAPHVGRNSDNTNTAEFNAMSAAYRLMGQPAATVALSSLSYGRASIWAGRAALMGAARYPAADDFSQLLLGEKGAKHVGDPPWWEANDSGGEDPVSGTTKYVIRPALNAIRGE